MDRHTCKRNKALTCSFFAILAFIFSLVSCDNFNKPVRAWFKYYTEEASVGTVDIVEPIGSYSGITCVESNGNKEVKLHLRNPMEYTLVSAYEFDDSRLEGVGSADRVSITQSDDKNCLTLTFSKAFLEAVEKSDLFVLDSQGNNTDKQQKNLSGNISFHTADAAQRTFNPYHISVIVNSAPPRMRDAMFQYDKPGDGKKYVVCFKIPNLNNTVHQKDTKTLVINGETYNVSFGSSVDITRPDGGDVNLETTRPSDLCNLNLQTSLFTSESGYINFYYYTDIAPTVDRKTVNITLSDDYDFKTDVVVSNSTGKLIQPTLSVTDGNTYQVNETDGIYPLVISHTGESTKYDEDGNQVSGDRCSKPNIFYKLYKDGVSGVFKEGSGAAPLTVNLEKGKYYVETYAYADAFIDSDKASGFAAESGNEVTIKGSLTYYVKNTGSDIAGSGNGSKKKPYRTIQKCIDEIKDDHTKGYFAYNTDRTIEMLSDLTARDDDVFSTSWGTTFVQFLSETENDKKIYYVLNGHGYTIDASEKGCVLTTIANTKMTLNNVNLTGGKALISDTYYYKGGGGIKSLGGIFTMNGGSITGCHSETNGGAVYIYGEKAITLNGVTITGNTAAGDGGGGYIADHHNDGTPYQLSLEGICIITGNKVGDNPSNVYLSIDTNTNKSKVISIGQNFTGRVGVTTQKTPVAGEPVVITKDFSNNDTGKPWERFFPDDPNQGVIIYNKPDETEAVLSVSSSLISAYNGEKIIVSCTETVNLNGSISVSVVDEGGTDITSQCTFVNRIIFYKSDPLFGSNYYTSNGNTVTLQSGITEKDIYVLFVQFRYKGFDYDARIPFRVQ